MPFRYPIALELRGRRCVVVGGDATAEGKARALLEAEGSVEVFAASVTPGLDDLCRRGELSLAGRAYRSGDLAGAFLVVACEPDRNTEVYAEAETAGVLCNAVDDVDASHFAMPSVLRRGDLMLAISTGGRSPALAKHLRGRLSAQFGWEYGVLVDLLGAARAHALANRACDFPTWAARWKSLMAEEDELIAMVRAGRLHELLACVATGLEGTGGDDVPEMTSAEPGAWPDPGGCGLSRG